jgi:GxxExxY protein
MKNMLIKSVKVELDAYYKIHSHFGPEFFESVYKEVLCVELVKSGLHFAKEVGIPVVYENIKVEVGFRADIIVENKVLVELKSFENVFKITGFHPVPQLLSFVYPKES